ncbi:hypothetical protein [Deinococcus multiflagellatus]|uniref:Uncharacterized protein n=1 Tax=Deinococcus multiflagellatus TaxID=1656887 RepID=A0ABW1ZQ98_9DEIO|nr:hypothetical protein [Deinococcus multiflagellatus]MBZ9715773.1 hypothetical protein [Deinococcus multiflagellatus]
MKNPYKAAHHADGREEAQARIRESLLQMHFEAQGESWIQAREHARQMAQTQTAPARSRASGVAHQH